MASQAHCAPVGRDELGEEGEEGRERPIQTAKMESQGGGRYKQSRMTLTFSCCLLRMAKESQAFQDLVFEASALVRLAGEIW
jgi:hypothetical protein